MRLTGVAVKEGCLEVVIFAQGLEGQVGVRASKAEVPTQARGREQGQISWEVGREVTAMARRTGPASPCGLTRKREERAREGTE